jgi:tryptophanyl-tRNA synthetase
MSKRIFSGIQPSGVLHIGNYLGAIKQWVGMQNESDELIFCVVDLHAITVPQKPEELKEKILSVAAMYIACGIDPKKSKIFVQSMRPEHAELAWILNCIAKMGELSRMTQFKEKSQKGTAENASVGLFDYPVLMASDILLYQTTHVPVGADQTQHVEIARDLAIRFNNPFGQVFTVPEVVIKKEAARIMALDEPSKKMSKSASSAYNYIALTDSDQDIRNKIKKAMTDSGSEIKAGTDKPAISNLLAIMSEFSARSITDLELEFKDKSYGEFKEKLAKVVVESIVPIREKYINLMSDKDSLIKILEEGNNHVESMASDTLAKAKKAVGLGYNI